MQFYIPYQCMKITFFDEINANKATIFTTG